MKTQDYVHIERNVPVAERYILPTNSNIKLVWLGNFAASMSILAALYFIIRVSIMKTTDSFSYLWLVGVLVMSACWSVFGWINKIQPTILSSTLMFLGYLYLLIFKAVVEGNGWAKHQQ